MTSEVPAAFRVPPADQVFPDEGRRLAAAAAERGDAAAIRDLGTVDLDAASPSGANLLMYEIVARREVAARALLEAGADPNHVTADGGSPMLAAAISDDPRWLRLLLEKGGDPNLRTVPDGGEPLLTLLVPYGRWDSMLTLLDHGADIEASSPNGQTAVIQLATLHQFDRVEALLDRGADPARMDVNGLSLRNFVTRPLAPDAPQEPARQRVNARLGVETPGAGDGAGA